MLITNNIGTLVFDDQSPLCELVTASTFGSKYAFIQCIDASPEEHSKGQNRGVKRYWGLFEWETKEQDILNIMETGGKWPELP